MAQGHGGYRKPANPAPVSGPGALSRRTDGGPQAMRLASGGKYGERKQMAEMQSSAPMKGGEVQNTAPLPPVTGLFEPTQRPNEPVTAGSPLGAGPGPEVLNLPNVRPNVVSTLKRLATVDESGEAEVALQMLSERGIY